MEKTKIVKSYANVWQLNRKFYSFGGVEAPVPLTMNFMAYFFVGLVVMKFFGGGVPGIIRYLLIPGGIAWLFDQKLIDGKTPYQFFRSITTHYYIIIFKGYRVNRFKYRKTVNPSVKAKIAYRIHYRIHKSLE